MTQFKVGDRVAFYSGRDRIVTEVSEIDNGILLLKDHDRPDSKWIANPHQCRKLRKRERRRVWIFDDPDCLPSHNSCVFHSCVAGDDYYANGSVTNKGKWIEFVEVRKVRE